MAGVEFLHQPDERNDVPGTGGLVAGVHGQLGQADVHAVHGYLRHGKVAQSAAADLVGTVGKILQRDTGAGGKLFGAVTSQEISDALREQFGIEIEKNKIVQAEPIKTFGAYTVKAKLGYEVSGTINVLVVEG